MQYPIIDLITSAYINNGWTGLDISTGKNLLNTNDYISYTEVYHNFDIINNSLIINGLTLMGFIVPVEYEKTYTFSSSNIFPENVISITFRVRTYSDYPETWDDNYIAQPVNVSVGLNPIINYTVDDENIKFIMCTFYTSYSGIIVNNLQLEEGSQATPYEPYGSGANDFPNRLKLPLPHYFPHPVIEALQRAAAGTQTADDTEILRHYLTPLGIGGI